MALISDTEFLKMKRRIALELADAVKEMGNGTPQWFRTQEARVKALMWALHVIVLHEEETATEQAIASREES